MNVLQTLAVLTLSLLVHDDATVLRVCHGEEVGLVLQAGAVKVAGVKVLKDKGPPR